MLTEVLKSPSLEILQTQLDKAQQNLSQAGPVLIRELDQIISRDLFQPASFCDYETFTFKTWDTQVHSTFKAVSTTLRFKYILQSKTNDTKKKNQFKNSLLIGL